jgi:purine-binding chemotaxis protein CheW
MSQEIQERLLDEVAVSEKETIYLMFEILGENSGLDVSEILSIVHMPERISRVPNAPSHVRGVMNLRGTIIPVLDTSIKLGGCPLIVTPESRIVVADIEGITFGVMVDAVREVCSVRASQVEVPDASRGGSLAVEYVSGIAKLDDGRLLVLLDLAKVFDLEGLLLDEE